MPHNFKHRPLFSSIPSRNESRKAKIDWVILPFLWTGVKRLAMALGFLVLLQVFILVLVMPAFLKNGAPPLPKDIVLFYTFDGSLGELSHEASFSDPFAPPSFTVREMVSALDRAAKDNRVKGFVARMNDGPIGLVHAQEIRAALLRFKEAGKFAYIYSPSYGDSAGGLGRYYLASAFDEIWMQPMGIVTITGVSAEMPFLRKVLDKIGVEPNFYKRKDYKTAYENLTNSSISPENKEMIKRLIGDIRDEILAVVPAARGMEPAAFTKLVDKGLFTAPEAKDANLITHAEYGDVMVENVKEAITGERDGPDDFFVSVEHYADATRGMQKNNPMAEVGLAAPAPGVALIYAVGAILPTSDSSSPVPGRGVAAADEIAGAIIKASEDDAIKAIVMRIDSPGGSPTASETILRAVERAQEKGKPVIVSMGTTAASGGYWIAAYADQIFVLPATITGSIGVIGGKFSAGDLWSKLDVNWDIISWGKNSDMWSFNKPFSESEAERINAMLDAIYEGFLARVAKGRKMDVAAVDKIAGGRVWSGKRAVEIGLADQLGGLDSALDYTANLLGKKSRADLDVYIYPKPKTAFERVLELLEGQVMLGQSVRSNAALLEWLTPISGTLNRVQNPRDFAVFDDLQVR